ncbi:unnamed protein product [Cuscuta epithymum]|uniref:RING-type E3 ubiquitin transferase n=1 Tax=Cuscuta epithymum TaxID=186058 RepID=A0AAV0GFI1_9ASTE|nr:unnamed protein product [Cuscuta epithymum]
MRRPQYESNPKDVLVNPCSTPSCNTPQRDSTPPKLPPSSGTKISPAVLLIIVMLSLIFFISGLLHLLVRFLMKKRGQSLSSSQSSRTQEIPNSGTVVQRQLQQLFHLHDSGLDQAFIDSLPLFTYKDIMGLKEPFDCAVCLCEFTDQDHLRLLPLCSHAFHMDCIDTWLLSNSTCPLCRGVLFPPDICIENPMFRFDDSRIDEDDDDEGVSSSRPGEDASSIVSERRVFSVRLGKFRSGNNNGEGKEGETSGNRNMSARRCYSMGSFQYVVVGDSELQVALSPASRGGRVGEVSRLRRCGGPQMEGRGLPPSGGFESFGLEAGSSGFWGGGQMNKVGWRGGGLNGNLSGDVDSSDGKRIIDMRSKGESFSISKIWLWSKKDKLVASAQHTHFPGSAAPSC